MVLTTIRSPPPLSDFIPLDEHQTQTPETFFGGKPILHYHATGAKAWIAKSQRGHLPFFPADLSSEPTGPEGSVLNGNAEENCEQIVDLLVNSQNFIVFCPAAASGVSIPYPSISLHAIKHIGSGEQRYPAIYLQLDLSDGGEDDETFDTIELTIIPPTTPVSTSAAAETEDGGEAAGPASETAKLFEAISECSNLNPDPAGEGDDDDPDFGDDDRIVFEGEAVEGFSDGVYAGTGDGGLPPPMPGSSGWITAENVHEYFDADGNWIGEGAEGAEEGVSGELGEGAGVIHERDDEVGGVNGHGQGEEGGNKRPRNE